MLPKRVTQRLGDIRRERSKVRAAYKARNAAGGNRPRYLAFVAEVHRTSAGDYLAGVCPKFNPKSASGKALKKLIARRGGYTVCAEGVGGTPTAALAEAFKAYAKMVTRG